MSALCLRAGMLTPDARVSEDRKYAGHRVCAKEAGGFSCEPGQLLRVSLGSSPAGHMRKPTHPVL